MGSENFKALLLGDIVGEPGRKAIFLKLPQLIKELTPDAVIVNAENADDNGCGISPDQMKEFFDLGIDVITSGNHIWENPEILPYLDQEPRILRPYNYPSKAAGHGLIVRTSKSGHDFAVLNLQGRYRMSPLDDPFQAADTVLKELQEQKIYIIVDFHAEDSAEKEALGWYLDGRVSAVVGTHTHVATSDNHVLPGGTAYQTDLGMCGPSQSIIGNEVDLCIQRLVTQLPLKGIVSSNPAGICGALVTLNMLTKLAVNIEAIDIKPQVE